MSQVKRQNNIFPRKKLIINVKLAHLFPADLKMTVSVLFPLTEKWNLLILQSIFQKPLKNGTKINYFICIRTFLGKPNNSNKRYYKNIIYLKMMLNFRNKWQKDCKICKKSTKMTQIKLASI